MMRWQNTEECPGTITSMQRVGSTQKQSEGIMKTGTDKHTDGQKERPKERQLDRHCQMNEGVAL